MGATQKQRRRPNKAKGEKASSRSCEQVNPHPSQDNCAAMPYSGPVTPWFWMNPYYYTFLDYSRMYILLCIQPILLYVFGWIHIIFNILLYIQPIFHKDRLAIIWLKRILIAARRVRRTWRKIQNTYSQGDVPQAYLTLKKGGCNGYASKKQWSNKWRSS